MIVSNIQKFERVFVLFQYRGRNLKSPQSSTEQAAVETESFSGWIGTGEG